MSYPESIRGALAATSSAARRVQALKELGLPEQYETMIQQTMDAAVDGLITVSEILQEHGHTAPMAPSLTKAARTARLMEQAEKPWKSVKDQVKENAARKNSAPALEQAQPDASHPWRDE